MRTLRTLKLILCLAGVLCVSVSAQTRKLNNEAVLKMKTAGLDDATIIKAIETTPGEYDTSADGLIALKTGGASDGVLAAILNHTKGAGGGSASPKAGDGYLRNLACTS